MSDVYLCKCGNFYEGERPECCPVCDTPANKMILHDRRDREALPVLNTFYAGDLDHNDRVILASDYNRLRLEVIDMLERLADSWVEWAKAAPDGYGLVAARVLDKFVPELRTALAGEEKK